MYVVGDRLGLQLTSLDTVRSRVADLTSRSHWGASGGTECEQRNANSPGR